LASAGVIRAWYVVSGLGYVAALTRGAERPRLWWGVIRAALLTSKYPTALSRVLPADPADLRTVFVPTAGRPYPAAPWLEKRREWLRGNDFRIEDLDLAEATTRQVRQVMKDVDLVYVEGGNTYFLLHHMRRVGFLELLGEVEITYAGASAGAIVLCPDIGYIGDLDDRSAALDLTDTTGAGFVDFAVLPHADDPKVKPTVDQISRDWNRPERLVVLNDDQAVVVDGVVVEIVPSPPGDHLA
jgi:dipeptidase E